MSRPAPEGYVQEYIDTFSGAGPEGIGVGDVLVLAGCPAAPDGLLHKVLAIQIQGATTVMRTEQASLEDAVQSVDLNYGQRVEEDDLQEATFLREGAKLVKPRDAAKKLGFDLAWQIDCEHDGLKATGRLELSQKFDVNVKISWFKLQSARFVSTTRESTELKLTKTGAWGAEKEWVIARYPLPKITVWVGPLPVVINPELQIFVGASGQVEAGITTGVHQEASVTIGADYVRGRAGSDFRDFSTASFDAGFHPPALHAAAELKGYAGVERGGAEIPEVRPRATAHVVGSDRHTRLLVHAGRDARLDLAGGAHEVGVPD